MIIGEWLRRLSYLLRRSAHEDELRREMESHRAEMGEPPTFGNALRLREESRDAWGWRWLDDLVADTRFAVRMLRHSPGFALTAVVTLALGIGVNIGMFSLVNGLLFRPLYEGADEVVTIHSRSTAPNGKNRAFSYPNYRDLRDGTPDIFANLAAVSVGFVGLDAGIAPRSAYAAAVTANYFDVFNATFAHGRGFTAGEEQPGAAVPVAIISYQLWEQLEKDPGVLGRLVRVNGEPFTIVGVAQKGFSGTSIPGPEIWLPLGKHTVFNPDNASRPAFAEASAGKRDVHEFGLVARLRPGVPVETAEAALATAGRRLEAAFPSVNTGYSIALSEPSSRLMFLPTGGPGMFAGLALLLMLMPMIVLLVACLNLADLLLARGHMRRQELAIRSSLGGGRSRLIRQLLTEGLLLAAAGGAVGLVLSTLATKTLLASIRPALPVAVTLPEAGLDWRVLAGTVAFCLVATLVFGVGPARFLTGRAAAVDLKRRTGEEGRRPGGFRMGNLMVVGQIALSVLLLASAGLFMMSVIRAATVDPGFRLDGGVLVRIDPGLAGYNEARSRAAHLAVLDRLRAVPGVDAVTIASSFPFTGFGDSRNVVPAGATDAQQSVDAVFTVVGRDYARVLGLPFLSGRDFTDAEMAPGSGERVAIVDDELAAKLWPGENVIGRRIQFIEGDIPPTAPPMLIVGIIPAIKHSLGNPRPAPHVYVPIGQHYESAMTLQLRLAGAQNERAMVDTITRVVRDVDERLPVLSVSTWRDHLDGGLDVWVYRAGAGVFSTFGAIALLLAVLGVYGVKSYIVSRRTREFGIRIAIGAHPRALLWQVLREDGRITAIGVVTGLLLAIGAGQFFQSILYGVNSFEPVVLVTAPLILLTASLFASYVPARRATTVNPTVALRSE
jgi:predicted permease